MKQTQLSTRERIVEAASALFYGEGIRAVSVDAVAEKAGLTKRTLYYHFASKDELIAAYLEVREQPNLARFRGWYDAADGSAAEKTRAVLTNLARTARHPKWKGCAFLRTSGELANMPGHPAMKIARGHKKDFERWFAEMFAAEGIVEADALARHVVLLLDGSFALVLLHRDPAYMEAAGDAAFALVSAALAARTAQAAE